MKTSLSMALTVVLLLTSQAGKNAFAAEKDKPVIQIALLLDTSNSMDGLIQQAKTQLWKIVNEFATTKKNGQAPNLQVALYEYGKSSLPSEQGYIRLVVPLSDDLDKMSEELFALKTNGGDEYCGQVIKVAGDELAWSKSNDDFKAIFIAGNEPFTQGHVDYRQAVKETIAKGIVINTIFCGPFDEGVSTHWKDGAVLADGSYMSIDQNRAVAHVAAPQDKEIARLGEELNKTYIAYGEAGEASKLRQSAQDHNAAGAAPEVATQRAISKSSTAYNNAGWDLVDAVRDQSDKLATLKEEQLPEEMKSMTAEQRKAYVDAKAAERVKIKEEIKKLNAEREKHVTEEMKKQKASDTDTLDSAMIKCLREQAQKKNYSFE